MFAVWLAAVAWLSVPRHDLCIAVAPAPPGCAIADRVPTAIVGAVVMVIVLAVTARLTRKLSDRVRVGWVGFAVVAATAVAGYRVVLFALPATARVSRPSRPGLRALDKLGPCAAGKSPRTAPGGPSPPGWQAGT